MAHRPFLRKTVKGYSGASHETERNAVSRFLFFCPNADLFYKGPCHFERSEKSPDTSGLFVLRLITPDLGSKLRLAVYAVLLGPVEVVVIVDQASVRQKQIVDKKRGKIVL
jgi:hypothetical protein